MLTAWGSERWCWRFDDVQKALESLGFKSCVFEAERFKVLGFSV